MDLLGCLLADAFRIQSIIIGLLVFLLLKWWLTEKSLSRYNLPPGPRVFPLIGNLPQILTVKEFNKALMELSKKHGDLYKLEVANFTIVVVCGLENLREGLIKKGDALKGRPNWIFIVNKIFKKKGIIFNTGHEWKDLRRFTISNLRDFGMGKCKLEEKIHTEITELVTLIESHQGKPFNLKGVLAGAVMNVIYNIVFGQRLDYTEPDFEKLTEILDYLFKNGGLLIAENFFPWLYHIRWNSPAKILCGNDQILQDHFRKKIHEHRETFDGNNPRDFIDMYLLKTQTEKSESYSEANIFRTIVDLFSAGSETSATYLLWAFLYMAKYTDVQQQCREEIRKVTDFSRMVKMSDREELPFVNATIHELHRIATIAPASLPRVAESDTTLGGYDIPKGTIVQFMIESVHNNPKYWKDPHLFDPNRWLNDKKEIINHEAYLPFSWGPRSCLGEPLAKMEIFLFFSNLLQQFQFTSSEEKPVNLEGQMTGVTFQPINSIICAKSI